MEPVERTSETMSALAMFLMSELAARKFHSAIGRAPGSAAQRWNRGDACSGNAAHAGRGSLDTQGFVGAPGSRWAASSIRRRGPLSNERAFSQSQLCLLQ